MTVREFTDRGGAAWHVWAVRPPSPERRSGTDRRGDPASDPWYERRGSGDRRVGDHGRPAAVAGPLANGWLCFEAQAPAGTMARKRLAPIPPDWEDCSADAMCAHLEQAAPVVSRIRSA